MTEIFPKIKEGFVWQYQAINRGDKVTHQWSYKNEKGGVHIHCWISDFQGRKEWLGGIECHWPEAPEWADIDNPHHDNCWLLGKPCWHYGSSLRFSENVAPYLPDPYSPDCDDMKHCHGLVQTELWSWFSHHIESATEQSQ